MELDDNVNDINDTSRNVMFPTSCKLPFILQGEFFKVTTRSTDQKIIAQCKNCPKTIMVQGVQQEILLLIIM